MAKYLILELRFYTNKRVLINIKTVKKNILYYTLRIKAYLCKNLSYNNLLFGLLEFDFKIYCLSIFEFSLSHNALVVCGLVVC